ncbi:MAG: hypothetical protein CSA03_03705 [Bacteroidetes bacterium]|nr:MAG: hypothetical protein CSA03_03705 [Bacteroidota bacterium]
MKNISIPEPCSENWNEMTPTEKGAFCQKCALEVIDFTNKSADEIRSILVQNIGNHACMRIKNTQIEELNDDFASWKIKNPQSFQRAWVFTLIVVFGMTLFSCEEEEEPIIESYQKVGQTILEEEASEEITTIDSTANTNDIAVEKKSTQTTIQEGDSVEYAVVGETILEECVVKDEMVVTGVMVARDVEHTAGVPMISREYDNYLIDVANDSDTYSFQEKKVITGLVYPNPAVNQTTLKVELPKRGKGQIGLFALNGQKISTIYEGRMKKGESEYSIDLSGLETGFYLINVISGDMKETIKFSKI